MQRLMLLLCCAMCLSCIVIAQAQRPFDEGERKRIGITSQQQKQLEALFASTHPRKQAIQAKLGELYHELHELYEVYDFDTKRAKALQDEICAQHLRFLAVYAENEIQLRRILNRGQFERMRAELKEKFERHRNEDARREGKGWHGEHGPGPRGDGAHPLLLNAPAKEDRRDNL